MKKLFLIGAAAFMFSCNNEKAKEEAKTPEPTAGESKVVLPVKMIYDGSNTVGNPENIVKVMNFNTDFVGGKLDNIGSYLADSIHAVFADGTDMTILRDSMVAVIKAWRGSMDSAKQVYISAIAVDNKVQGHEWVMQWLDETHYYKGGKKEHVGYHEDYRLVNGKIREMFQYTQGIIEKK